MSIFTPIKPIKKARIGLYTIGLRAYWNQFEGLRERLIEYGSFLETGMQQFGEVFN
jgi:L-arabinose isomerase